MGAKFTVSYTATSTASTTVPMGVLTGGTLKRLRLYGIIIGSVAAPANQANQFSVRRTSARGTSSQTVTPNPLDPADPACQALFDTGWSVNPTITASSDLAPNVSLNQQSTFSAQLGATYEMVIPAVSGAGAALMAVATTAAVACQFWTAFEE